MEEDFGQKCQHWVVTETLHGIVSMMTATLLSLKGHFCPSFTPIEKKSPLRTQKSHGST
jgi:hypothetical protein